MLKPDELKPNGIYYVMNYYDRDLTIPYIETYLYDGVIIDPTTGVKEYLFRLPESTSECESDTDAPELLSADEISLNIMYTTSGLISELKELVKRLEES